MTYQRWTFHLPAFLEDDFVAEVWGWGALGFEVFANDEVFTNDEAFAKDEALAKDGETLQIDAYFELPAPDLNERWTKSAWAARGARLIAREDLREQDWLAAYRGAARPFEIGRLRIDPRDPDDELGEGPRSSDDQILLHIPAQTAFGTGSHDSTRLVLEWLQEMDLQGLEILDVGTGSAILSLAALALGAQRVFAFDIDPISGFIARANARRHALEPRLFTGRLRTLRPAPRFDLALVNILPQRILPDLGLLAPLLRPGGRVLSSGNLIEQRGEILESFADHGLRFLEEKRSDEWVAFLLAPVR